MPNDALNYYFLAKETDALLAGGKIEKITSPSKDTILLFVRNNSKNYSLLLCCNAQSARCHITREKFENPSVASSFLMHLRKHIGGGKIINIEAVNYERIVNIHIDAVSELGIQEHKILIAEIMGKHSNIILVNSNNIISESIRHISSDISGKRTVLAGLKYFTAPAQSKVDLSDEDALTSVLEQYSGGSLKSYISATVSGLSSASISEAIFLTFGNDLPVNFCVEHAGKLAENLIVLYDEKRFNPCVYISENKVIDFFYTPYKSVTNDYTFFDTLSSAMDKFYSENERNIKFNEKKESLKMILKSAAVKLDKKLAAQIDLQEKSRDADNDKKTGELLAANIYKIKKGMTSITVDNYFIDSSPEITIELDENLSPQQNLQRIFKRYNKKKNALLNSKLQIEIIEREKDYLESVDTALFLAETINDLNELSLEMSESAIIASKKLKNKVSRNTSKNKNPNQKNKKANSKAETTPDIFKIDFCGYEIKIGKNNKQNDFITKSAKENDMWFHCKDIHGAHIVISNPLKKEIPEKVIIRAAQIAAFYSKAKNADKVPVDYTFIKYVLRPKGAEPGKVNYTNQRTLYVKPVSPENTEI